MAHEVCDCADDLERQLRIENAAGGQFPETSGWAILFGIKNWITGEDKNAGRGRRSWFNGGGNCGRPASEHFPDGRGGAGACPSTGGDCAGAGGRGATSERKSTADILIPIIGGGLVFLGLLGFLYRYFDVGTAVRSRSKEFFKQLMELMCGPQTANLAATALYGGKGRGGTYYAQDEVVCDTGIFATKKQPPYRKHPCGKDRIDPSRRKHPAPPTQFTWPVIPGLHDCSDDEDYEEGVFVAPGPHED